MRRLVVIEGRASPEEFEIGTEALLGRARETDLRIFDETASRQHARILEKDGRVVLDVVRLVLSLATNLRPSALFTFVSVALKHSASLVTTCTVACVLPASAAAIPSGSDRWPLLMFLISFRKSIVKEKRLFLF